MSEPNAYDQYMLELINQERAQVGAQPLADNSHLNDAAGAHSQWMIDTDIFSHTGAGGSSPTVRMQAAGFQFSGAWSNGENIAWESLRGAAGYADEVNDLNIALMNSPGHRANLLNGGFTQIGLGVRIGELQGYQGVVVTQDFAQVGSQHFLTGVAFADADKDRIYDPGEGLAGLTVTAASSSGQSFAMMTYGSGGYDLALPAGSYTVTFSGPGVAASSQHVDIGSANVKLDLVDPTAAGPTPLVGGAGPDSLAGGVGADNYIRGDDGADTIVGGDRFNDVNGNKGDDNIVGRSLVGDWLLGGQGNDQIDATASSGRNILNGNLGSDTVTGGSAGDVLRGGQGDDVIHAGSGDDWISGDLGTNSIYGGQGMDTFHAGAGHDVVSGWHNGDIVQVGQGVTVISVSQVNADVHVALSNAGEIDLLNTQQTSLQPGWIVTA